MHRLDSATPPRHRTPESNRRRRVIHGRRFGGTCCPRRDAQYQPGRNDHLVSRSLDANFLEFAHVGFHYSVIVHEGGPKLAVHRDIRRPGCSEDFAPTFRGRPPGNASCRWHAEMPSKRRLDMSCRRHSNSSCMEERGSLVPGSAAITVPVARMREVRPRRDTMDGASTGPAVPAANR